MDYESDWNALRQGGGSCFGIAGMGILRFTLLFGSAAMALALIIASIADGQTRYRFAAIRRSVLQSSPNAICFIQQDGSRRGDCN